MNSLTEAVQSTLAKFNKGGRIEKGLEGSIVRVVHTCIDAIRRVVPIQFDPSPMGFPDVRSQSPKPKIQA